MYFLCLLCALCIFLISPQNASAHPLGNFTINRYSRVEVAGPTAGRPDGTIRLRYIIDMAEIPTFQALQTMDMDEDGVTSETEKALYLSVKMEELRQGLHLWIDQQSVELEMQSREIGFPPGQGGLLTLRMSAVLEAPIPPTPSGSTPAVRRVEYKDENDPDRLGWREIVVRAMPGATIRSSTAPDRDLSDELRTYPQDMLSSPLNERGTQFTFVLGDDTGLLGGIGSLGQRAMSRSKDAFAELISARTLSSSVMMWSLLVACGLGALHALSPGHGKTIVGAYLVGARGTAKHALFLGLTVTATHTSGVFALGLLTLYASEFILPEQLYPWLSVASGLIVVVLGVSLFVSRLRNVLGYDHDHEHGHDEHDHGHGHDHGHSHLPAGADEEPVTWRSLLALGVSGGLLPCPSALVVLLGAIALHRVGFGLLLIVAFSIGLAGVLTGIGLLMVRARRLFNGVSMRHPVVSALPVVSAGVITLAGLFIVAQGLVQAGVLDPQAVFNGLTRTTIVSILGLGFFLGLKHALDADHLVAITTIVSERRGVLGSSLVGALWGLGHTASLLVVGLVVAALNLQIPERVALGLEFAVAVMLVVLGVDLIRKLIRGATLHVHAHEHGMHWHVHPHLHEASGALRNQGPDPIPVPIPTHSHHPIRMGKKPFFIGMMHGLAGSAALMLLVLVTIPSRTLGLIYIGVFGLGSIGGMLVMSTLVSLPFVMTAQRFGRFNVTVRALAGVFSVGFGLFLAWRIGVVEGLLL